MNTKDKFDSDLKLLRAFLVILSLANFWIAFEMLYDGQCTITESVFGVVCLAFGAYPTGLIMGAVSVWLMYFAFSKEMKARVAKHYIQ